MADLRGVLERAAAGYKPPEDQLERTLARVKRRERRKRIRAATLALFVAAAGLAGTIVVFRLGRATTPVAPPSSMAARVTDTIAVGRATSVAVGNGMMWAVTANGGLVQIDPATGQPTRGSATVPCTGDALAVGAGGVWCFGPARERALTRFNPETGEVDVAMRPDQGTGGTALATSPGSVWVVNGEQITRIDLAPSPP